MFPALEGAPGTAAVVQNQDLALQCLLHRCRERPKLNPAAYWLHVTSDTKPGLIPAPCLPPRWRANPGPKAPVELLKAGAGWWWQLRWETRHHPSWVPGHHGCDPWAVLDPSHPTCSFLGAKAWGTTAGTLSNQCLWLGPWWSSRRPPWLSLPQEEGAREGADHPWAPAQHLPRSACTCSQGRYWERGCTAHVGASKLLWGHSIGTVSTEMRRRQCKRAPRSSPRMHPPPSYL